ncbi:MAG: GHMP kinase [Candidatus Yonathbacteria bacterium]|nr:GHMP kinase [Candidatus Yonathbacteria bacterium]
MIITRAPLRISFVGGGTDIKEFYSRYPGRVLSTSIDKFVYIVAHTGNFGNFIMKYSKTETVEDVLEISHTRFKEALVKMEIPKGIEIASFADLPAKTGLGSSSSFTVALMKALYSIKGKKISKEETAQAACELEIDILKEPIGKQDQYAAAYGGLNVITFNTDGTVSVEPVFMDFKFKSKFENHMMLFFTGMTRSASSVLSGQKKKIDDNFETYKKMSDSVLVFRDKLLSQDLRGMGEMLHEAWQRKKTLASSVTNDSTDALYETAIKAGAWGGKILGAGGGGCLLFMAEPGTQEKIQEALEKKAKGLKLNDFKRVHFGLTVSGIDVLFNSSNIL